MNPFVGERALTFLFARLLAVIFRYTYSLVFAADMYQTVFKKDPLSPELGSKYRQDILRPGGSRDEIDSLKVKTFPLFGNSKSN